MNTLSVIIYGKEESTSSEQFFPEKIHLTRQYY